MKKTICVLMALVMVCSSLMTGCMPRNVLAGDINLSGNLISENPGEGDERSIQKEKVVTGGTADKVTGKQMKLSKKSRMDNDALTSGYNSFALKALQEAIATGSKKGENLMISPASLMFALDMAAMGAKGKTYKQIAKLFSGDSGTYPTRRDLTSFAKQYRKMLENSGLMDVANSIWINENNLKENNIRVNEAYLNLLRKQYKAAAASLPFNDAAKKTINGWIDEKTRGMIKEAVDSLSDDSLMLIVNAMAFEGVWKQKYEEYQINENGEFTNSEGKKEKARMLSSEEGWYLSSDDATGFLKYYEGDKYAFMAILPNDSSISVNDYIAGLSGDALEKFYNSRTRDEVDTVTPAFNFDYSIEMNDMLKNMGMKKAFEMNANFLDMIDPETVTPDLLLYIGSVIQKTHIELDENGTKAAAVTIIDMKATTTSVQEPKPRKRVILDRPFAFAIMDTESGTPVFAGVVNTIE